MSKSILPKSLKIHSLEIFCVVLVLVLGFWVGRASASEPVKHDSKKVAVEIYGPPKPQVSVYEEVQIRKFYSTSTTTTTTTAPKHVEVHAPSSVAEEATRDIPNPIESVSHDAAYWLEILRSCETHGNYQSNTGNGYYGAYQFSYSTWKSMGTAYEYAYDAPPEVQDDAAYRLMLRAGTHSQFPGCSKSRGIPNKF